MSGMPGMNGTVVGAARTAVAGVMPPLGDARSQPVRVDAPDPEVRPKAGRRRFSTEYKLRVLEQAEQCGPGEVGALLRREGLYSSHLTLWRRQRAAGALQTGKKRAAADLQQALRQLVAAEREIRHLKQRLERAETILTVQKKLSTLLQLGSQDLGNF